MNTHPSEISVVSMGAWPPPVIDSWHVAPGWRERFGEIETEVDWLNLLEDPRAHLVKANPNRQVWRLEVGGQGWYVKVFRPVGWRDRVRELFGGVSAWHEWQVAMQTESLGVPCVTQIACGLRRRGWGRTVGVLVSAEVAHAVPLPDAWHKAGRIGDDVQRGSVNRALGVALADLLARSHQVGFMHRDGHPGNVLIQDEKNSGLRAIYADLYGATVGRPVTEGSAVRALAQLQQWFRRHASRAMRLRFLKLYLTRRFGKTAVGTDMLRHWTADIERCRRDHAAKLWQKRDRRIWRQGKYFRSFRLKRSRCRATVCLQFRNPGEFPQPAQNPRDVGAWGTLLAGCLEQDPQSGTWPSDMEIVHCQGGGARQLFAVGQGLRHRDVPAVWPLALVERRGLIWTQQSDLLIELREPDSSLSALSRGLGPLADRWRDAEWRRRALAATGRLLADAFCQGITWAGVDPLSIWIECWDDEPDRPRALVGVYDGWRLSDRPPSVLDEEQARRALHEVGGFCPESCSEDRRFLLEAFQGYLLAERGLLGAAGVVDENAQRENRP